MPRRGAAYGLAALSLIAAGCGAEEDLTVDSTGPDPGEVEVVKAALSTTNSGTAYAKQCDTAGVPLPPDWGVGTASGYGAWTVQGNYYEDDSFFGLAGHVWYHVSSTPPGVCVVNAHDSGLFDTICQGTNGKACFWEKDGIDPNPPSVPMVIASKTVTGIPGGNALANSQACGECHSGENAFITHNQPFHPLNLTALSQWMPTTWHDPIVSSSWKTQNPGPATTGYPVTCTNCHKQPPSTRDPNAPVGGRFPVLARQHFQGNYCSLLETLTDRPASKGGMPPSPTDCQSGYNCPRETDPAVRAMLETCGMASGPPVIIGALGGANGIGSQYIAKRYHLSSSAKGFHQHYFYNATMTMPNAGCCTNQNSHPNLLPDDKINVYVYLPIDDVPRELMIEASPGGGTWNAVYWGSDLITGYTRKKMGAVPSAGGWQVLSFTTADLALPASTKLTGMSFALYDGSAAWSDVLFLQGGTYANQSVSQMWVGDAVPAGAAVAYQSDYWTWRPENLAVTLQGTAYTSSTYPSNVDPVADAHKGNDDNVDGNWSDGSVFHTGNTTDTTYYGLGTGGEYWFVDFGRERTARGVVLHNRTDCCMDRLSHFRIAYWNGSQWKLASDQSNTITSAANPIIPISFSTPVNTRYIMVQKADHNYLHLAEVQVYGDP